ncbi:MAG: stage II sporulation protein R [Clostridiales bacterium]|nr:stage II sporulation protein R [Clostridiales bacterium]
MTLREECFTGLAALLLAFLIGIGQMRMQQEALAGRVAPQVLRLHVIANSDDDEDQAIKLEIRSLLLDRIEEWVRKEKPTGKADAVAHVKQEKNGWIDEINAFLKRNAFSYLADIQLTECRFPPRQYGNVVFPEGMYDAVRVVLGEGKGRNWWCVLYPSFCFVKEACHMVPEDTLAYLREHLNRDDCLALLDSRPDIQIRFLFFPFLNPSQ